jgi:hypothetical protein
MTILRHLLAALLILGLGGCANSEKEKSEQPAASQTYPPSDYAAVKKMAAREDAGDLTRLVGWDEDFYYFDWSQQKTSISRGIAKVARPDFDIANGGALTLSKGLLTVNGGKVRNLELR